MSLDFVAWWSRKFGVAYYLPVLILSSPISTEEEEVEKEAHEMLMQPIGYRPQTKNYKLLNYVSTHTLCGVLVHKQQ